MHTPEPRNSGRGGAQQAAGRTASLSASPWRDAKSKKPAEVPDLSTPENPLWQSASKFLKALSLDPVVLGLGVHPKTFARVWEMRTREALNSSIGGLRHRRNVHQWDGPMHRGFPTRRGLGHCRMTEEALYVRIGREHQDLRLSAKSKV